MSVLSVIASVGKGVVTGVVRFGQLVVSGANMVLDFGPVCPKCGKRMKNRSSLGMSAAMQETIDVVTGHGRQVEYVCKSYVHNPQHTEWVKLKKERMAEGQSDSANLPQEPPESIPCDNHWKMTYDRSAKRVRPRAIHKYFYKDPVFGKPVPVVMAMRSKKQN